MKTWGYILLVLGVLASIGHLLTAHNPSGAFFLIALGIFLIYRAKVKSKEEADKKKWEKDDKSKDVD